MKNTNEMPFGYKANGEINILQAEVIKSIFDVINRYCDKVTVKELEAMIEEHKEMYDEELKMKHAWENLTVEMTKRVIRVINKELNKIWKEYLSAKKGMKVSGSDE